MSHSLGQFGSVLAAVSLTIVDYAAGGEAVSVAGLNYSLGTLQGVLLGQVAPNQNSLGVPLFPILSSGKIMLFRFVSGVPTEIPATTALNATFTALLSFL